MFAMTNTRTSPHQGRCDCDHAKHNRCEHAAKRDRRGTGHLGLIRWLGGYILEHPQRQQGDQWMEVAFAKKNQ
jgi:hypothetical protein